MLDSITLGHSLPLGNQLIKAEKMKKLLFNALSAMLIFHLLGFNWVFSQDEVEWTKKS